METTTLAMRSSLTPAQFDRIAQALAATPPRITGAVIDRHTPVDDQGPRCCALGSIGLAAGYTVRTLSDGTWADFLTALGIDLASAYQLVAVIYCANDKAGLRGLYGPAAREEARAALDPRVRAAAVLDALRPFVVEG